VISIWLYICSCFASYFSMISFEASLTTATMKSKSSNVREVCILVTGVLGFFLKEYFRGETFLFFDESSSSLGGGTLNFCCSVSVPYSSSPSSSGVMEAILTDRLSTSWTSSVFFIVFTFFILLGPSVSYAVLGLSMSDIYAGSAETRRSINHSLVISSRSSSVNL
jgi:cytochrome c biogenesis protein CcdA